MYTLLLAALHAHKSQVMWAWGDMTGEWTCCFTAYPAMTFAYAIMFFHLGRDDVALSHVSSQQEHGTLQHQQQQRLEEALKGELVESLITDHHMQQRSRGNAVVASIQKCVCV